MLLKEEAEETEEVEEDMKEEEKKKGEKGVVPTEQAEVRHRSMEEKKETGTDLPITTPTCKGKGLVRKKN